MSKVVAEYDYPLPDGTPNRRVQRTDPKGFKQQSHNPENNKWYMNLKHGIPVWFRAVEMWAKAKLLESLIIIICEGEEDALAGAAIEQPHECFTCYAGGAKKNRSASRVKEELKDQLRELKKLCKVSVIVIPDSDEVGFDHGASIAMAMNELEIHWVTVQVHHSLTHVGADFRDHLEAGFTIEDLEPLDLGVPHWNDPDPVDDNPMTGIPLEHANYIAQSVRDEMLWINGREDPWHLLEPGGSLFRPGGHRALARAASLTLDRYQESLNVRVNPNVRSRLAKLCNPRSVSNALEACKSSLECSLEDLGEHKYPNLICVPNGILDLEELNLRSHDPALRFTKMTGVLFDPEAGCEQWLQHLEVWQPNEDNRRWLLKLIGLCLLGTQEAIIPIHYGQGSDGKSVFWNVIGALLGDYDRVTPGATWMKDPRGSGGTGPNPAIARCEGTRLVRSSETHVGALLDEVAVKGITGGDLVAARALYRGVVTWKPQMVLSFVTNHPMRIKDNSRGMQRRIRYIPWEANIPRDQQILDLDKKLILEEGPGIFRWMCIGAQLYLEEGLSDVPAEIALASRTLLGAEEDLQEFLEDVVDLSDPDASVEKSLLYLAYSAWANKAQTQTWSKQKLSRQLMHKGWKDFRQGGVRRWKGVQIRKGARQLLDEEEGGMSR